MNRLKPSFFIIGERKCGTSSLFRYLCSHPQVLPGKLKESDFFSRSQRYVDKNIDKYYSLFPDLDEKEVVNHWPEIDKEGKLYHTDLVFPVREGVDYITGEASANVFSTVNPKKLKKHLPDIKLIIILRDPVERAFSHHAMHQRFKQEGRLWFQIVTGLSTSFQWERFVMKLGIDGPYISPGRYVYYLKQWLRLYHRDQIFIMQMKDLEAGDSANLVMNQLAGFLGIDPYDFTPVLGQRYNTSGSKISDEKIASRLRKYYEPFNKELEQLLGRKFYWDDGF